ncbi:hypothetical protein DFH09DRAFT_1312333 [Mycena vulgaris]|nr:hypothetical protein DFH09DRAFT_1312333 [Mycena vulgaris]
MRRALRSLECGVPRSSSLERRRVGCVCAARASSPALRTRDWDGRSERGGSPHTSRAHPASRLSTAICLCAPHLRVVGLVWARRDSRRTSSRPASVTLCAHNARDPCAGGTPVLLAPRAPGPAPAVYVARTAHVESALHSNAAHPCAAGLVWARGDSRRIWSRPASVALCARNVRDPCAGGTSALLAPLAPGPASAVPHRTCRVGAAPRVWAPHHTSRDTCGRSTARCAADPAPDTHVTLGARDARRNRRPRARPHRPPAFLSSSSSHRRSGEVTHATLLATLVSPPALHALASHLCASSSSNLATLMGHAGHMKELGQDMVALACTIPSCGTHWIWPGRSWWGAEFGGERRQPLRAALEGRIAQNRPSSHPIYPFIFLFPSS